MKIISSHTIENELILVCIPETEIDFEKYYYLRWDVLRKPWNQPLGSEQDDGDKTSMHFALVNEMEEVIGTCRLQLNSTEEAQIRYMCVSTNYQGKHLGDLLMHAAEEKSKQLKATYIFLQARENAVSFYKRNGYVVTGKGYLLFNSIQHYQMKKEL